MALKICGLSYRVQGCVFEPTGSILCRLLLFFQGLNKLASAQTLFLGSFYIPTVTARPSNILEAVFTSLKALSKIYLSKELQNIIQAIMKIKPTTVKKSY